MTRRVVVDRSRCIGAATCVLEAPGTFALDEHDRVVIHADDEDDAQLIRWAVAGCPVGALRLVEEPGRSNGTVA